MMKPVLGPLGLVALFVLALPGGLGAQAALEYGLQSGSSALSHITSSGIGGCNIDSALVGCFSHAHPRVALVIAAVICIIVVRSLAGITRSRAR